MSAFVDANLLIYLNASLDSETREILEAFYIDVIAEHQTYTDILVLDELLYISKHKYGVPYRLTVEFIESLVEPYVTLIPLNNITYECLKKTVVQYGLKPSDAIHLCAMKARGINLIVSEDREFDKIQGIKRIWLRH
ncbi:type II toxin-antitoxin system VapC family toxin [Candidatus Bathyarchaeota archaeon]|nr:type II toxin-antitoxin system VapC family toxin [Candidatus Bathyarchaeota archaeon]